MPGFSIFNVEDIDSSLEDVQIYGEAVNLPELASILARLDKIKCFCFGSATKRFESQDNMVYSGMDDVVESVCCAAKKNPTSLAVRGTFLATEFFALVLSANTLKCLSDCSNLKKLRIPLRVFLDCEFRHRQKSFNSKQQDNLNQEHEKNFRPVDLGSYLPSSLEELTLEFCDRSEAHYLPGTKTWHGVKHSTITDLLKTIVKQHSDRALCLQKIHLWDMDQPFRWLDTNRSESMELDDSVLIWRDVCRLMEVACIYSQTKREKPGHTVFE